MKWFNDKRSSDGIVLSSRVRLARNLADYPFPKKCTDADKLKICNTVKDALGAYSCERFNYIQLDTLSGVEKNALLEDHMISREFCEGDPSGRMLITDEQSTVSVMVNEEDHLRIQVILPGLDINSAYKKASEIDEAQSRGAAQAFDEKLGYLTSCPTNLGTGMRASVMLHLPALTSCGQMKSLLNTLSKIGLAVRGLYGEGSEADGSLYQISNQITLGISEEDAIEKLTGAVNRVVERERQLRETLVTSGGIDLEDSICRSLGLLRYAKKMSSKEFLKLWSDVKFGVESGVIKELNGINLSKLLVEAMPAHILKKYPETATSSVRDAKRAEIIKSYFV